MPAYARTRMSATETYFVAATIVTSEPTSARTRSYRSRTASGDIRDHSLTTRDAVVATVREEELRLARGAEVDALDLRSSGFAQHALAGAPQIEVAPVDDVAGEARAIRGADLVADLVAARPDTRADRGRHGTVERRDAGGDDPLEQTDPADVENGERGPSVRSRERDRQAVGGHVQHGHARLVRPQPVAGPPPLARLSTVDGRRV